MKCRVQALGDGTVAIVCGRGAKLPELRCASCSRPTGTLCDFPVTRPLPEGVTKANTTPEEWLKLVTCSRPTCLNCGERIGGSDLCGPHVRIVRAREEAARAEQK